MSLIFPSPGVLLDGVLVSPAEGVLVRKAPGNTSFNFGQVWCMYTDTVVNPIKLQCPWWVLCELTIATANMLLIKVAGT
jgi:hypothetical protein